MRLGLNILTTFLHSLKTRKLLSSSRNTYLPNVFVRRNPRLAARAARLRATKSAGRIRSRPVSAAPSITTSAADGTAPRSDSRNGTHRPRRHARPLKRSTNAAIVPSYPQPPGAYACAPPAGSLSVTSSGSVLDTPTDDNMDSAPLVAQKIFFDALYKERAVLLRAADERREAAEAEARLRRAEEDAEYLRLLAEDQRKAQEAQRRAEAEEAEEQRRAEEEQRRLKEEMEAQERRRRRERAAEERRRRHAAREERRERARREEERLEQERRSREEEALRRRAVAEAALAQRVAEWHRYYEEKWAVLRADVRVRPLEFSDIPWPLFGIATSADDITLVHIQEFLCHPQRESVQSVGQARTIRSEMLRWHPDKFNGKVLNMVMEDDREAVKEAAGEVARILNQLATEMQGR